MSNLSSIFFTPPGHTCPCPLCNSLTAIREKATGFHIQIFCPNCGRYGFGDVCYSSDDNLKLLESSPEIRKMIADKLQSRKNKYSIPILTTDAFRKGKLDLKE